MGYEHIYARLPAPSYRNITPCIWRVYRQNTGEESWEPALQIAHNSTKAIILSTALNIIGSGDQLCLKQISRTDTEGKHICIEDMTDAAWNIVFNYLDPAHRNPLVQTYPMLAWINLTYATIRNAYEQNQELVLIDEFRCNILRDSGERSLETRLHVSES